MVPYLYHKACRGWESRTKGSGEPKKDRGGFCLSRLPGGGSPLASLTSVLVRRDHPGDLTPGCRGTWAAGTPAAPRGFGRALAHHQGCCASSHPRRCRDHQEGEKIARRPSKVVPGALPVCSVQVSLSSSLQHRRVSTRPLTSPLDLFPWPADGLWGGRNRLAQPWPDLALQHYFSGPVGCTEMIMIDVILA